MAFRKIGVTTSPENLFVSGELRCGASFVGALKIAYSKEVLRLAFWLREITLVGFWLPPNANRSSRYCDQQFSDVDVICEKRLEGICRSRHRKFPPAALFRSGQNPEGQNRKNASFV
jgi:hypothetical protein